MSNPRPNAPKTDPYGTLPLFTLPASKPRRKRRSRYRCPLCGSDVTAHDELCPDCASAVLTDRVDPATGITKPTRLKRRRAL